jgi:alanyl-tRNA synthetase
MTADELRTAWTDFFVARAHTAVPSGSLIPTHPSAPMFTNSGMMPFVPMFLGEEPVPYVPPRAVSIQKCVRAGGKHNDLDAIGRSARHLSFFEMLGNFSFGDYFKAEAIPWAWEFVTEVLGIDPERLWVTCHVSDDEAEKIWVEQVGVPIERIQRLDKDNFWEMGETGPCGPSSEIFYDHGPELGPRRRPRQPRGRAPLRRDLEPGVPAVLPLGRRLAVGPADPQHRHRRRHGAHPRRARRQPVAVRRRRARRARRAGPDQHRAPPR